MYYIGTWTLGATDLAPKKLRRRKHPNISRLPGNPHTWRTPAQGMCLRSWVQDVFSQSCAARDVLSDWRLPRECISRSTEAW